MVLLQVDVRGDRNAALLAENPVVSAGAATTGVEDVSKMTVPQLKERLKERGMSRAGRKADLVARLLEVNRRCAERGDALISCMPVAIRA